MVRAGLVSWPGDIADRYAAAGHWRGAWLGSWPGEWARRYGSRIALVDGQTRISYRGLAEHVDALAARLLATGLRRGDNIVLRLPNCWEFVVLFFACQRIGVGPVLTCPDQGDDELCSIADQVDAKAVAVPDAWRHRDHQALAARVARCTGRPLLALVAGTVIAPGNLDLRAMTGRHRGARRWRRRLDRFAADPRDAAFFLVSGSSRLVARTHDDWDYSVRYCARASGTGPDDVFLAVLPAAHGLTFGAPGVVGTLASGGKVVLARSPHPRAAFRAIDREHATRTALTLPLAQRWLEVAADTDCDLSSLAVVQVAGAPLTSGLAARVGPVLGCRLQRVLWTPEGLVCLTRPDDPDDVVVRTQGRPAGAGDEVRVVDPGGRAVPPGESGELLARGPCVVRGYFAEPRAGVRSFPPGGWFRTGDLVRRDAEGNLTLRGHLDDVVVRAHRRILAAGVEEPLRSLPGVREACVIPVTDHVLGERVCACVVPRAGEHLALDDVRQACLRVGVPLYQAPEQLEVFGALPLTPAGEVDKQALRRLVESRGRGLGRSR